MYYITSVALLINEDDDDVEFIASTGYNEYIYKTNKKLLSPDLSTLRSGKHLIQFKNNQCMVGDYYGNSISYTSQLLPITPPPFIIKLIYLYYLHRSLEKKDREDIHSMFNKEWLLRIKLNNIDEFMISIETLNTHYEDGNIYEIFRNCKDLVIDNNWNTISSNTHLIFYRSDQSSTFIIPPCIYKGIIGNPQLSSESLYQQGYRFLYIACHDYLFNLTLPIQKTTTKKIKKVRYQRLNQLINLKDYLK